MDIIFQNPFRVLGLSVNTKNTKKEFWVYWYFR